MIKTWWKVDNVMSTNDYECEGQLEMTDFLKSKIVSGTVMDLTRWINSQGKAQYTQIGEVIEEAYERYKDDSDFLGRMTNAISIYVLTQSREYMNYLKGESSW